MKSSAIEFQSNKTIINKNNIFMMFYSYSFILCHSLSFFVILCHSFQYFLFFHTCIILLLLTHDRRYLIFLDKPLDLPLLHPLDAPPPQTRQTPRYLDPAYANNRQAILHLHPMASPPEPSRIIFQKLPSILTTRTSTIITHRK